MGGPDGHAEHPNAIGVLYELSPNLSSKKNGERTVASGQTQMDNYRGSRIESAGPLGLAGSDHGLPGPTGPGYQKFWPVGPVHMRLP
jgi:hypothetical protein